MFPAKIWEKSIGMMKQVQLLAVLLVAVVALILGATAAQVWAGGYYLPSVETFEDAACFFEVNTTDFDTGIAACVDPDPWKLLLIFREDAEEENHIEGENDDGKQLLFSSSAWRNLRHPPAGITELCFESNEPNQFETFLELFEEGICKFIVRTTDHHTLVAEDDLTHTFVCVGTIDSFDDGDCVNPESDLLIEWTNPTTNLATLTGEDTFTCGDDPIVIDAIQVIIETEDPPEGAPEDITFNLAGTAESVVVPASFLAANTEYKFEIIWIEEDGGNKTIKEIKFVTGSDCP